MSITSASKWQVANNNSSVSINEHLIDPLGMKLSAQAVVDLLHVTIDDNSKSISLDSGINTNCVLVVSDACAAGTTGRGVVLPKAIDCIGKTVELRWVSQAATATQSLVISLPDGSAASGIEKSSIQGVYILKKDTATAANPAYTKIDEASTTISFAIAPRAPSFIRFVSIGTVWLVTDGVVFV